MAKDGAMPDSKTVVYPAFKPCEKNVSVPTLLVEPFETGRKPEVWVQWNGKSKRASLQDMQFRFPVPIDVNAPDWFGHPEKFRVILFGPIRHFPNPQYANQFAREHFGGDPNGQVLYVISAHEGVDGGNNTTVPIAFLIPMKIELLDDMVGIISPENYYDPKVQQEVIDKFYKK